MRFVERIVIGLIVTVPATVGIVCSALYLRLGDTWLATAGIMCGLACLALTSVLKRD